LNYTRNNFYTLNTLLITAGFIPIVFQD